MLDVYDAALKEEGCIACLLGAWVGGPDGTQHDIFLRVGRAGGACTRVCRWGLGGAPTFRCVCVLVCPPPPQVHRPILRDVSPSSDPVPP